MEHTKQGIKRGFFPRIFSKARRAYSVLAAHKYTSIAGMLVFFLIMSLIPFLFWLTLLFGRSVLQMDEIFELELFGWAKDFLLFLKNNAEGATSGVSVLFLATTLWSSSAFFYHLRKSGEIIYQYHRQKHGWKVRLSAILLTFAILLYFAAAGFCIVFVNIITRSFPVWLSYPAVYSVVLVTGFFAAWILNAYVCPYRAKPSDTAFGSFLTAIAWLVASIAFAVYLNFSNKERLYGALSLVIVFLLWLYWMMICFTAGAIFISRRIEVKSLQHKTL